MNLNMINKKEAFYCIVYFTFHKAGGRLLSFNVTAGLLDAQWYREYTSKEVKNKEKRNFPLQLFVVQWATNILYHNVII